MTDPFTLLLIKEKAKAINYFIKQYKVSYEDSEGVYTDGLIKMLKTLNSNPTGSYNIHYFYTILHNIHKMQYKQKKAFTSSDTYAVFYTDNECDDDILKIYQRINSTEFWDTIEAFLLTRYKIRQVNMFKAKFKSNHTQKSIAVNYNRSEATVSILFSKMLLDLREQFADDLKDLINNHH